MATVAEKNADGATLIDDIASVLTTPTDSNGNQYWTDADTYVVNDGSTTDWHNNGRVMYNSDMGVYFLFYLTHNGNGRTYDGTHRFHGVRMVYSTDWDSTNHHPAGNTNVHSDDSFSGDVGYQTKDSYTNYDIRDGERTNHVLPYWVHDNNDMGGSQKRTYSVTYFLSAGQGYFTAAAWNTGDTTNGAAGFHYNEWTDSKFWNDGIVPFCAQSRSSNRGLDAHNYGFQNFGGKLNGNGGDVGGTFAVQGSAWGQVNPDANDDTFFFRRPITFKSNNKNIPGAYVYDAIHNDPNEGAAHGDTVTFNGVDYRCVRQSGASTSDLATALIRYE